MYLTLTGAIFLLFCLALPNVILAIFKAFYHFHIHLDNDVDFSMLEVYEDSMIRFIFADYKLLSDSLKFHVKIMKKRTSIKMLITHNIVMMSQCVFNSNPLIEVYSYPEFNKNYKVDAGIIRAHKPKFYDIDKNLEATFQTTCTYIIDGRRKNIQNLEFLMSGDYRCFKTFFHADFEANNITVLRKKSGFLKYAINLVKLNLFLNPIKLITNDVFDYTSSLRYLSITHGYDKYLDDKVLPAILYHYRKLIFLNCTNDPLRYQCYVWQVYNDTDEQYDIVLYVSWSQKQFFDVSTVLKNTANETLMSANKNVASKSLTASAMAAGVSGGDGNDGGESSTWGFLKVPLIFAAVIVGVFGVLHVWRK